VCVCVGVVQALRKYEVEEKEKEKEVEEKEDIHPV
jgi:hypothetical protein